MRTINRAVMTVKPTQVFMDWLNGVAPDPSITLAELRDDPPAYLLPDLDDPQDAERFLKREFKHIFFKEMMDWHADPDTFPKKMTLAMFRQWFDIEISSEVIDMVDDEIEWEDE